MTRRSVTRVVFGTRNFSKLQRMQALFATLGLELVGLGDLDVPEPIEGDCVEENAVVKARTYASAARRPCIANDYGLRLEGLPDDEQPAAHVRRAAGDGSYVSDEAMMAFYIDRITALGGATQGTWSAALAIALDSQRVASMVAQHTRTFVSRPSPIVLPGEPLASLQIDPVSGRYISEIGLDDRAGTPSPIDSAYLKFVKSHLESLREAAVGS